MKTNELMIGDWVKNTNGNMGRVIGFHFYLYGERSDVVMRYNSNSTCWSEVQMLKPIPLTAEILKKNGLDKVPELSMVLNRDTMPMYHSPMLHSVHELQHALRLCGLNNLADDFKV